MLLSRIAIDAIELNAELYAELYVELCADADADVWKVLVSKFEVRNLNKHPDQDRPPHSRWRSIL